MISWKNKATLAPPGGQTKLGKLVEFEVITRISDDVLMKNCW